MSTESVILVVLGALQALCLLLVSLIWNQIRDVKNDLQEEILRLRNRLHKIEPNNETLERFMKTMEGLRHDSRK
jgi:predicted PurR-regulated permease PerM